MNVLFDPKTTISMTGTQFEDCTGNLTFKNFETSDVKFKFRMSNPKHFNAVPKVGILPANGEQQIEIKYKAPGDLNLMPKDAKIQFHLINLNGITDSENVFSENPTKVEKGVFTVKFQGTLQNLEDDMFLSPMNSEQVVMDMSEEDFTFNVADKIPWMKKK